MRKGSFDNNSKNCELVDADKTLIKAEQKIKLRSQVSENSKLMNKKSKLTNQQQRKDEISKSEFNTITNYNDIWDCLSTFSIDNFHLFQNFYFLLKKNSLAVQFQI